MEKVMPLYCNTNTDLTRAYSKIEEFGRTAARTLNARGWKSHTVANVFKWPGTGYVEAVYEDNAKCTLAASIATVNAAQKWYYDSTNDVLYFYPTGGVVDPHVILAGEDWATVKTDAVTIASRDAEALLDPNTPVPLPMSITGTTAQPYDRDFTHAVALIACGHIVARTSPAAYAADGSATADSVAAQLLNAGRRIVNEYKEHLRAFSWEITADEIGGANLKASSTNTSAGLVQIKGLYVGKDDAFWKIKILLGGAVGTATWVYSLDNGTTYTTTGVLTDTDWAEIGSGLWVRFVPRIDAAGDFITNDTWQLEVYNKDRKVSRPSIYSVQASV
jgi:hypothetical protein